MSEVNPSYRKLYERYINSFIKAHKEACIKYIDTELKGVERIIDKFQNSLDAIAEDIDAWSKLSLEEKNDYTEIRLDADTALTTRELLEHERERVLEICEKPLESNALSLDDKIALFYAQHNFLNTVPNAKEIMMHPDVKYSVIREISGFNTFKPKRNQ